MTTRGFDIKVQFIPPTRWWKRATWKLLEEYTSSNGAVKVPADFVTDGATIPLIFRWAFSPTGLYFGAAIVHDYLLVSGVDWDKANDEFNNEMKSLGVSSIRKNLILGSVNIWSKIARFFK